MRETFLEWGRMHERCHQQHSGETDFVRETERSVDTAPQYDVGWIIESQPATQRVVEQLIPQHKEAMAKRVDSVPMPAPENQHTQCDTDPIHEDVRNSFGKRHLSSGLVSP